MLINFNLQLLTHRIVLSLLLRTHVLHFAVLTKLTDKVKLVLLDWAEVVK